MGLPKDGGTVGSGLPFNFSKGFQKAIFLNYHSFSFKIEYKNKTLRIRKIKNLDMPLKISSGYAPVWSEQKYKNPRSM